MFHLKRVNRIAQRVYDYVSIPRPILPYFMLTLALLVTLATAVYVFRTSRSRDLLRFENTTEAISDITRERINLYIGLLEGIRNQFMTSDSVTQEMFSQYVTLLKDQENYPGLENVGYIARVDGNHYWPLEQAIKPDGSRETYYPVYFIEPRTDRNTINIGYDVLTEPARRKAVQIARDTGLPTASEKLALTIARTPVSQPGFVVYAPVYSTDIIPSSITARRDSLEGFVFMRFLTNDLIAEIFRDTHIDNVDFTVYDGTKKDAAAILFTTIPEGTSYSPLFKTTEQINIAGRIWTIDFFAQPDFNTDAEKNYVPSLLIIGIIGSLIVFYLSRSQYLARIEAENAALLLMHSEQALLEANKRNNDILESITDSFIAINRDNEITYINNEAYDLIGKSSDDDIAGNNLYNVFPTFSNNHFKETFNKAFETNQPQESEAYYRPLRRWYTIKAFPSKEGLSLYFHDITERKRLEEMKDEFIAIASHELKTPVTSIKLFTQVIQRKLEQHGLKTEHGMLNKVISQLNALTMLINDLLDVNKIQSGKLHFNSKPFRMQGLVKETVEDMQITTSKHTIEINGETHREVEGDYDRIRQVLVNLISNAIKYSPDANNIIVHVKDEKDMVSICIEDFGIGIDQMYLDHIFERFFRVTGSDESQFKGMGIGLYISSEIIKRHNGRIWVQSEKGKGSKFCFKLPVVPES